METILKRPVAAVSLLVLLCGYLFFFNLGGLALTDPDETFYAQTAKEMVARSEWSTPYLYGKPQFEKPILYYWLLEISYKLFGVTEFSARLPSAVFGTLGVITVFFLGSLLFTKRAGFFAALMLATNVEYIILSRACITDMVLFVFMLLGGLFFCYGYLRKKDRFYLLSAAAFALAVLTKGPIYIALAGAVILLFLLCNRDIGALRRMPLWQAALVFVAIAAPWYAVTYKLHGAKFIDAFFGFHNVTRFFESEHKIGSQVYYNIPIILGGFFPWSVFLPVALWRMGKKAANRTGQPVEGKAGSIFTMAWLTVIFVFFTISSTKLPTYVFPCFLSLALASAVLWDDLIGSVADWKLRRAMGISHDLLAIVVVCGALGGFGYVLSRYADMLTEVAVSGFFLVFGIALSLVAFRARGYVASLLLIVYSVVVFLYPANLLILPKLEPYESSKDVSRALVSVMKPDERLGAESNYLAGLAFYTGVFPVDLDKHHNMVNFMNAPGRSWAVMKAKNHGHLYDPEITKEYVRTSYMLSEVGKRALITTELPENGAYLKKKESTFKR